jgi:uncharacterized protein YcbK (DUF882 family)
MIVNNSLGNSSKAFVTELDFNGVRPMLCTMEKENIDRSDQEKPLTRRGFLGLLAGAAATLAADGLIKPAQAGIVEAAAERHDALGGARPTSAMLPGRGGMGSLGLNLHNPHTKEELRLLWYANGYYSPTAYQALNVLLRDWREEQAIYMDMRLYVIMSMVQHAVGLEKKMFVNSGFRTPKTNAMLVERGGAAKNSFHLYGRAVDLHIPGIDPAYIRDMGLSMKLGGVGYYPDSDFCHLDTGPLRYWDKS